MKESYIEGVAARDGPESCAVAGKGGVEALTGVRAGRGWSRESSFLRGADAVVEGGRPHPGRRYREASRDPARSKTPCTHGNTLRGSREIPCLPEMDGPSGSAVKSKDVRSTLLSLHGLFRAKIAPPTISSAYDESPTGSWPPNYGRGTAIQVPHNILHGVFIGNLVFWPRLNERRGRHGAKIPSHPDPGGAQGT
jgi:hypothetical protein